jgi:hypothetical protein
MASQDKEVPQEARKPFGRSSNMATSMIVRIMKDILLTMSDVSSRLCSGLPCQILERENVFAPELKAGFLFCRWRTTVIGLYGTCSGLFFFFFLFFFPFHKVVRRAEYWAANGLLRYTHPDQLIPRTHYKSGALELPTSNSFQPSAIPLPAPRLLHARACTRFRFTVY